MFRLIQVIFLALLSAVRAGPLPAHCRQAVVGIARDWNDSSVVLQRYELAGKKWKPVGTSWNGRLGKAGLVWGRGLHVAPAGVVLKVEGDGRAPAGVFALGSGFGLYPEEQVARPKGWHYQQIGPRDLWVEDPGSPYYNQHLTLPRAEPTTEWEKKQQMRLNDPAHALKIYVGHNNPPKAVANGGSAIFMHIWRSEGARPTTGCTTMPERRLRDLLAWLNPVAQPVYILLPRADYSALRAAWQLP